MKEEVLGIIQETLQEAGLVVKRAENADLQADAEFLDASVSSLKKPVMYHALISADVRDQVIYLYETLDGVNGEFASKKLKRIVSKPFGKTEVVRLSVGSIVKSLRSAVADPWKVRLVNSVQKVEFAKGGFDFTPVEEPVVVPEIVIENIVEPEIPSFNAWSESAKETSVEERLEEPIRPNTEKTEINLFYLAWIVIFVIAGMVLNTSPLGYVIGFLVWVVFLYLNRKYNENPGLRIGLWLACGGLMLIIAYLTLMTQETP